MIANFIYMDANVKLRWELLILLIAFLRLIFGSVYIYQSI